MSHCVGGYAEGCLGGRCVIYTILRPATASDKKTVMVDGQAWVRGATTELIVINGAVTVHQLRGFANAEPPQSIRLAMSRAFPLVAPDEDLF